MDNVYILADHDSDTLDLNHMWMYQELQGDEQYECYLHRFKTCMGEWMVFYKY